MRVFQILNMSERCSIGWNNERTKMTIIYIDDCNDAANFKIVDMSITRNDVGVQIYNKYLDKEDIYYITSDNKYIIKHLNTDDFMTIHDVENNITHKMNVFTVIGTIRMSI